MKIKYLAMILASSFIGIVLNPELLAASDSLKITDINQSNLVETKILAKSNTVSTVTTPVDTTVATTVKIVESKTPAAPKAGVVQNEFVFSWGKQNLVNTTTTSVDAGKNIMKVGKLAWAHNTTSFNKIKTLKIGDIFSVTENGVTKKYRVVKNPIDGKAGVELKVVDKTMFHESVGAIYTGAMTDRGFGGHDLVLMTCSGTNGRYIVVADLV